MAIHPSPRLAALLLFSHLLAAVSVYVAAIFPQYKIVILLSLLLSFLFYLARDVLLLLPNSWHELSIQQGEISVIRRDATVLIGRVADGTVVTPYFVLLRVRQDDRRWVVARVIFPDALERDGFRDLCVRLRLG